MMRHFGIISFDHEAHIVISLLRLRLRNDARSCY